MKVFSAILRSLGLPALLFLLSLTCYLTTLTEVHTFDALSYILDVDHKPWQELFHPHHLAYGPLGTLVRTMAARLGWNGSSGIPMQITNALAGALGVALFFALVRDVTHRPDLALCSTLLLWGSYAYWYYAIEVEVYTIAALFLILSLWLMVYLLKQPSLQLCIALGLTQGCAVLFHQTNVLLSLPVALVLLLATDEQPGRAGQQQRLFHMPQFSLLLAYSLSLGVVVVGAYIIVSLGISKLRSWAEFATWMSGYVSTGWWGGPVTDKKWADLGIGLTETLAQPSGALLWLLLVGFIIIYLRRLLSAYPRLVLALLAWVATYGIFFFWWEPKNIEFWIASLPPIFLLLALALKTGGPRWHPGVWMTLAMSLTVLGVNYDAVVQRGRGDLTPQRQIARDLAAQSKPGDLLLVPDGLQKLFLVYYEGRTSTLSLNDALYENGGNWSTACSHVQQQIEVTLEQGGAVLLGDMVLYPPLAESPLADPILERFHLTQEEVTSCFAVYIPDLVPVDLGNSVRYYKLPSAQEFAEGLGWHFDRHRWGWQTANIRNERFNHGWGFVPGIDPQLTSPPLAIEAADYCAITLRIGNATAASDLALFFFDERRQIEPTHVLRWTLPPHSHTRTYRLPLEGRPGWKGIITGLRLDPVGVGDGGQVRIESVQLVRNGGC